VRPLAAVEGDDVAAELEGYGQVGEDVLPMMEDWDWDKEDDPIGAVFEEPTILENTDDEPLREPWDRHEDLEGRIAHTDLKQGSVIKGEVSAMILEHGYLVDVGADYDGLVYVHKLDMPDICDIIDVGTQVSVRINKTQTNVDRFVFPVELDQVSPNISDFLLEPPRVYPPVYWYDDDDLRSVQDLAFETGRPIPDGFNAESEEEEDLDIDDEEDDMDEVVDVQARVVNAEDDEDEDHEKDPPHSENDDVEVSEDINDE